MAKAPGLFVKIDPSVSHMPQAALIPFASLFNDGAMTKEMVALLQQLAAPAWLYVISQPTDDTDFIVNVPPALQVGTANYQVVCTIATPNLFTNVSFDLASQTPSQFRVTTDGLLPSGTKLLFSLRKVA